MKPFINQVQDTSLKPGEVASDSVITIPDSSNTGGGLTLITSGTYTAAANGNLLVQLSTNIGLQSNLPPTGNAMVGNLRFVAGAYAFNPGLQLQQATVEQIATAFDSINIPVVKGQVISWFVYNNAILPPPGGTAFFARGRLTFINIAQ